MADRVFVPEWKDSVEGSSNFMATNFEEEPDIDLSAGFEVGIDPDTLEPISISIETGFFDIASDDWYEVGRSEPIDAVVRTNDSGAHLKFKWCDQGW